MLKHNPFSHTFSSFIGIIPSIALSLLSPPTKTESTPFRDLNRRKARLLSDIRIIEPPAINDRHGSLHPVRCVIRTGERRDSPLTFESSNHQPSTTAMGHFTVDENHH
ncbi:Hypothetical predicted protein [Olea europaea subsp. europaea]|uniref:Uncharacterized protein n=1 Tax=Olea europaea subsp. europaea TaxID=158383 RepID=A0A8S0UYD1_OLEEU|nr:Hypothetical predicted protein [Olea europaea subsp. europaea]